VSLFLVFAHNFFRNLALTVSSDSSSVPTASSIPPPSIDTFPIAFHRHLQSAASFARHRRFNREIAFSRSFRQQGADDRFERGEHWCTASKPTDAVRIAGEVDGGTKRRKNRAGRSTATSPFFARMRGCPSSLLRRLPFTSSTRCVIVRGRGRGRGKRKAVLLGKKNVDLSVSHSFFFLLSTLTVLSLVSASLL
jgi:hypothetical protein